MKVKDGSDELFDIVPHKNKYMITPEEFYEYIDKLNTSNENKEKIIEIIHHGTLIELVNFLKGLK